MPDFNSINNNQLDGELVQFTNCRLVRSGQLIKEDLWIRNGKIINPERVFFEEKILPAEKIDCQNAIIGAGFIDLQINGGYGVDFSYNTETVQDGIERVSCGLAKCGVTSFCPTLVTSPPQTYQKILPNIPQTTNENGAIILGVHLEGPFINPIKKGAHPAECIQSFDNGFATLLETYGNLDLVKIVTLAPEKDPDGIIIKSLTERGITVALGHSTANLNTSELAVHHGATLITHLFNAMLPFHHRDPGLVGLLASDAVPTGRTVYFGLIADGVHTHPAALRIAYRTHPDGLILVTDAISALGLQDGIHHIGQRELEVRNGKAYLANTDTLCGSIAPLDACVRIFQKATKCSIAYAIESASLHPAKCLNIEHMKGSLNYDADADFNILDDNLNVLSTWIGGKCVHSNQTLK